MRKIVSAAVLGAAIASGANAVTIWAYDNLNAGPDNLITFDSATPQTVTVVGSAGIDVLFGGLDFAGVGGTLYAYGQSTNAALAGLYSVNTSTGAATRIGGGGLASNELITDISWDPATNRMLGLGTTSTSTPHRLYSINLNNGFANLIGQINGMPGGLAVGLATNASGVSYVHDLASDQMFRLDAGLNATPLGPLGYGTNFSQGMTIDWSGSGVWYHGAIRNVPSNFAELYTINPANGAGTLVGTIGPGPLSHETGDVAIMPAQQEQPGEYFFPNGPLGNEGERLPPGALDVQTRAHDTGRYVNPFQDHGRYPGIDLRRPAHYFFNQSMNPPGQGQSQSHRFSSMGRFEVSIDGGRTWQCHVDPTIDVSVSVTWNRQVGATRFFDTEILSLDISGGTLPPAVMAREDPARASVGQTTIRQVSEGYMISSFFEIFLQISLDGGATWLNTIDGRPLFVRLVPEPNYIPDSFAMVRGFVVSGFLQSVHFFDGNRLVTRPGPVLNLAERPIQIVFESNARDDTVAAMVVVIVSHCNIPNINQRVEEFNFTTSTYTLIDSRIMPTADLRLELNVPMPSQHIDPTPDPMTGAECNLIRLRVSYKEGGPVFSYPWFARIDELGWRITR